MLIEKPTRAYFTLISNDSLLISALVLGYSLRKTRTDASLVCQYGPDVSQNSLRYLEELYDIVEPAKPFSFPESRYNEYSDVPHELEFSFCRLHAWRREEFKRITYIDTDTVIFQSLDDLFMVPGVAAARDLNFRIFRNGKTNTDYFNGGLVTFSPSAETFDRFHDTLRERWVYLGAAEQHLVNLVCRNEWFRIPDTYNVQAGALAHARYVRCPEMIKMLHFARTSKPWDANYKGRKDLYRSWCIFARMWVQVMREYSQKYNCKNAPNNFGWQGSRIDYQTSRRKKSLVKRPDTKGRTAIARTMTPAKMAEIAVYKGADQKISELSRLIAVLRRRKLRTVVEIGTARGGTLWLWCQLSEPDAHVLSIDLPGRDGLSSARVAQLMRHSRRGQSTELLGMDSQDIKTVAEVMKLLDGRAVDFLFIDADHSYRGVRRDFELYAPLVRGGGLIAFHDVLAHPQIPGCQVDRFWTEIRERFRHREFLDHEDDRGWGQWGGIGLIYVDRSGAISKE